MFGAAKELYLTFKKVRVFLFIPGEYKNFIRCFEARVVIREPFLVLEVIMYYGSDLRKNDC